MELNESAAPLTRHTQVKNGGQYLGSLSPAGGGAASLAILDSNDVNRVVINSTAKTIANGSATSLADIACASGSTAGGMLFYSVSATDGTDFQHMSGMVAYSVVNKAGVLTLSITDATPASVNSKAVSAGTITLAWTFVTGTGKGTIKLQPTTSLTVGSNPFTVTYTVFPMSGSVTIL